jgi:hypothetical protein
MIGHYKREGKGIKGAVPLHTVLKAVFLLGIGEVLNCAFFRNSECPLPETVEGGKTATYSSDDPFAGEVYDNGTVGGIKIHRPLFVGQGLVFEYYQDLAGLESEQILGPEDDPGPPRGDPGAGRLPHQLSPADPFFLGDTCPGRSRNLPREESATRRSWKPPT